MAEMGQIPRSEKTAGLRPEMREEIDDLACGFAAATARRGDSAQPDNRGPALHERRGYFVVKANVSKVFCSTS
jgi:hypothetical protein